MRKIFVVTLVILSIALFSQENKRLYITKMVVAKKKSNGKYWDIWKGAPDLKIVIYLQKNKYWQKVYSSANFKNSYVIKNTINTKVDLNNGDKIKIEVIDQDVAKSDQIGLGQFQVKDKQVLKFGLVLELSYFLSRYKSLKEIAQAQKEKYKPQSHLVRSYCKRAKVLMSSQKHSLALKLLQLASQTDPQDPLVCFYQAQIYLKQNKFSLALAKANSAKDIYEKMANTKQLQKVLDLIHKIKQNQSIVVKKVAVESSPKTTVVKPKTPPIVASKKSLELMVRIGHSHYVSCVQFSPDGKILASGSADRRVKLWDFKTRKLIRSLTGHTKEVSSIIFCSDSKTLISSGDKTVRVWNFRTGKQLRSILAHESTVSSIALHPNNKILASGSWDKAIKFWDFKTGKQICIFARLNSEVYSLAFSRDGKILVSSGSDKIIRLWDVASKKLLYSFVGHSKAVSSIVFSPDGSLLASASWDKTIKLWDMATKRLLHSFKAHVREVESVKFSPDGKILASGSSDQTIKLWNVKSKKMLGSLVGHKNIVYTVDFSPDGKILASGSEDRNIKLWDIQSKKLFHSFSSDSRSIIAIAYNPDGTILASGSRDKTVKLWNMKTGKLLKAFLGHSGWVSTLAFSPDGKILASGSRDRTVKLWNVKSGKLIYTFTGYFGWVSSIAFSPDGSLLASGSWDRTVRLWNVQTGKLMRSFIGHLNAVFTVAFSPDGRTLASGSWDRTVRLWNVQTGKSTHTLKHKHWVMSLAFSPNGKILAAGNWDRTVTLWDMQTKKIQHILNDHRDSITSVVFSPDGKILASTSLDKRIQIWDVKTGKLVRTLMDHTDIVFSIVFNPNGKILASGSWDQSIKLWKLDRDKPLISMFFFGNKDWLTITPEGFFDGSQSAFKLLHFVSDLQIYKLEQFFESFYQPGLFVDVMTDKYNPNRASIEQKLRSSSPPQVEIVNFQNDIVLKKSTIKVKAKITNTGGGIKKIRFYHNNKLLISHNAKVHIGKNQSIVKEFEVYLLSGRNAIKTTAFSFGNIEAQAAELTLTRKAGILKPKLYGLVVGVNQYEDANLNLNYAKPDAVSIRQTLIKNSSKMYQSIRIATLYDHKAIKENILKILDKIINIARPQDVVLLYFSGHGETIKENFYFLPHETKQVYDHKNIAKYGLDINILGQKTKQMKARKIIVIFDACKSGAALVAFRGVVEQKAIAMLARSFGLHVISASTAKQYALEITELGHGVLTYTILEGLKGKADTNNNKIVTIFELISYIDEKVPELTHKHFELKQYPVTSRRGMDFPVMIK